MSTSLHEAYEAERVGYKTKIEQARSLGDDAAIKRYTDRLAHVDASLATVVDRVEHDQAVDKLATISLSGVGPTLEQTTRLQGRAERAAEKINAAGVNTRHKRAETA